MSSTKVYVEIPFAKKDEAKKYGCKWDPLVKSWFVEHSNPNFEIIKTLTVKPESKSEAVNEKRVYLYVPFDYRSMIKAVGAKFDQDKKEWYVLQNHPDLQELKDQWHSDCFKSNAHGHIRIYQTKTEYDNKYPKYNPSIHGSYENYSANVLNHE